MSEQSIKRNQEGARVYYDVQSSHGPHYHQVEMLGLTAISCTCEAGIHKKPCRHKRDVEKAEANFSQQQGNNPVEDRCALGLLNGDRSFSLLKR